jgi:hypothetical protein
VLAVSYNPFNEIICTNVGGICLQQRLSREHATAFAAASRFENAIANIKMGISEINNAFKVPSPKFLLSSKFGSTRITMLMYDELQNNNRVISLLAHLA